MIQEPDSPKTRRLIWALIVLVLGVCIACGAVATLGPAHSTPTATPTATTVPTITPAPTTPPLSAPTLSETEYLARLIDISDRYIVAFGDITTLAQAATDDPDLFASLDWQNHIVMAAAAITGCNDEVRQLVPPARFIDVHFQLMGAADAYDTAMDQLVTGALSQDPNLINQAAGNITIGNARLQQATGRLEALDDRSG